MIPSKLQEPTIKRKSFRHTTNRETQTGRHKSFFFHLCKMVENMEVYPHSLIHCILVDSSTVICWASRIVILEVSGLFCRKILLEQKQC